MTFDRTHDAEVTVPLARYLALADLAELCERIDAEEGPGTIPLDDGGEYRPVPDAQYRELQEILERIRE